MKLFLFRKYLFLVKYLNNKIFDSIFIVALIYKVVDVT